MFFTGWEMESHGRHSQGARVIKCDSTVYIIRLPLPALTGKAMGCFPRQLELRVMLLLKEVPHRLYNIEYFTSSSIL